MKGYIYNENDEIIAIIHGNDNRAIENEASSLGFLGTDEYGLVYSSNQLTELTVTEHYYA